MSRLEILPGALRQLEDIGDYIAEDNPIRAASFIDELLAACRLRAELPRSGRERPELDGCPRSFPFGNYVVLYDIPNEGNGIRVLAVIHAKQDVSRQFKHPEC